MSRFEGALATMYGIWFTTSQSPENFRVVRCNMKNTVRPVPVHHINRLMFSPVLAQLL